MARYCLNHALPATIVYLCLLLMTGCDSAKDEAEQITQSDSDTVSEVPLRVWVASSIVEEEMIRRQWLADSSQPVKISQVEPAVIWAAEPPDCDVILFPARYLGDAVAREAIVKLPANVSLEPEGTGDGSEQDVVLVAAERAQVAYGRDFYAVPLGCSVPTVVASESYENPGDALDWDAIVDSLLVETDEDADVEVVDLDLDALVDRFLFVAGTISTRNPSYGLLFEMQSMSPRLGEAEFVEAAEILASLSRQPGGQRSVLASHSESWQWAANNESAVIAIADPSQLNSSARALNQGRVIKVARAASLGSWNTGGAMVAAISVNCRQSAQAIRFLGWLLNKNTRSALSTAVAGIVSVVPPARADQLSWLARQQSQEVLRNDALPHEPSLPFAFQYRQALGKSLQRFIQGECSSQEALVEAADVWEKITSQSSFNQRNEYENSLGLTL